MRLTAKSLTLQYNGRPVVDGVSLDLDSGELVAVVGPNGSGKTTLLRGLSRLLKPAAARSSSTARRSAASAPAASPSASPSCLSSTTAPKT